MPRVSEDHLTARREQILEAARVCFLTKGLHSTSMQDLIREAGLSVGAVYRYFKSKNEIIGAIAEHIAGGVALRMREIAEQEPPVPLPEAMEQVLALIDVQLDPGGSFPLAVQIWGESTLDPAVGEIVRERYALMYGAFLTLARRAHERGELPADSDPEQVATVLFGMVPGYGLQRMMLGKPDRAAFTAGLRALLPQR